ncbi:DUF4143 domain-containing protein [Mycobacterium novum]
MGPKTDLAYDRLLTNLLVAEEVPWWTNRFKRLVRTPKRYLLDAGIVAAQLRLDVAGVRRDGNLLGRVLDTFVMAQLRFEVAVSETGPTLYHLRSEQGPHKVDIVVEYADGAVFGFEIKAGGGPSAPSRIGQRATFGHAQHLCRSPRWQCVSAQWSPPSFGISVSDAQRRYLSALQCQWRLLRLRVGVQVRPS